MTSRVPLAGRTGRLWLALLCVAAAMPAAAAAERAARGQAQQADASQPATGIRRAAALHSAPVMANVVFRKVVGEGIVLRQGPGINTPMVMMVDGGVTVTLLVVGDDWARIRLPHGQEGWMKKRYLSDTGISSAQRTMAPVGSSVAAAVATRQKSASAPAAPPSTSTGAPSSKAAPPEPAVSASRAVAHAASSPAIGQRQAAGAAVPGAPPAAGAKPKSNAVLDETKPDPGAMHDAAASGGKGGDRTVDSPLAAIGDAWRMLAFLVPILALVVGGLHLLRRYQERHGHLPVAVQAFEKRSPQWSSDRGGRVGGLGALLTGGAPRNRGHERSGGKIRIVESMPLGGANVHLIEVHGRILLVGATQMGLSLLTEFPSEAKLAEGDFRALLQAASADLDGLDVAELPAATVVGALDEAMRDAGNGVARRARRLQTVQEAEESCS